METFGWCIIFVVFGIPAIWLLARIRDELKLAVAKIAGLANVQVDLVKQESETSSVHFPLGATACNHFWEVVKEETIETDSEKKLIVIQKCSRCGLLDKTIEAVSKLQGCKHRWRVQNEVELDSAYEQCTKQIKRVQNHKDFYNHWTTVKDSIPKGRWAFKKTYVCTRVCDNCGAIDTVQASNYDTEEEVE